jgi:hypothetical protein
MNRVNKLLHHLYVRKLQDCLGSRRKIHLMCRLQVRVRGVTWLSVQQLLGDLRRKTLRMILLLLHSLRLHPNSPRINKTDTTSLNTNANAF